MLMVSSALAAAMAPAIVVKLQPLAQTVRVVAA
jgi:hypothetical protein